MNDEMQEKITHLETSIQNLENRIEHLYRHLYEMICDLNTNIEQSAVRYELEYPQKDFDDD